MEIPKVLINVTSFCLSMLGQFYLTELDLVIYLIHYSTVDPHLSRLLVSVYADWVLTVQLDCLVESVRYINIWAPLSKLFSYLSIPRSQ